MQQDGEQNRANLRLVGSTRTPKEVFHRAVAEAVNAVEFKRGNPRPRRVAKAGKHAAFFMEQPRRVLDDLIDARVPDAEGFVEKLALVMKDYLARKRQQPTQDTGEFAA